LCQINWRWNSNWQGNHSGEYCLTVLEERNRAYSSSGNHSLAILKVHESEYTKLCDAIQDIVIEASNLKSVTINDKEYKIEYFLGGI